MHDVDQSTSSHLMNLACTKTVMGHFSLVVTVNFTDLALIY